MIKEDKVIEEESKVAAKSDSNIPEEAKKLSEEQPNIDAKQGLTPGFADFVMDKEFENSRDSLYRRLRMFLPLGGRVFVPDAIDKKIRKDMEPYFGQREERKGHVIYKT